MTLPLPLWCFLDGPLKGKAKSIMGRMVVHNVSLGWHSHTSFTYKIKQAFISDDGQLTLTAKMLPQQHRKWARIQRGMRT